MSCLLLSWWLSNAFDVRLKATEVKPILWLSNAFGGRFDDISICTFYQRMLYPGVSIKFEVSSQFEKSRRRLIDNWPQGLFFNYFNLHRK